MSIEPNIISFPKNQASGNEYEYWLSWAECELSILGHDLHAVSYDWKTAFNEGLKPEEAAEKAAAIMQQDAN